MYYYSLNQYLREQYGEKLYKLALSGGMSCPNRDGTKGTRGCIFCSQGGSGDFAEAFCGDTNCQIERAKARISAKTDCRRFIAYFQSYTNTYAPVDRLSALFTPVIARDDIAVLSVATRPDCIHAENAALLHRLNHKKPVWVELGLQTIHERTAEYIRRGYSLPAFEQAVTLLQGLHIVVHVILGLPGETRQDMEETVRYVAHCGVQGIKLQLLHVLTDTDLFELYQRKAFRVLEKEEYLELVTDLIEYLPPRMVVHRLTGDGPKRTLTAPLWSANKKDVLNSLRQRMLEKDTTQGRYFLPD